MYSGSGTLSVSSTGNLLRNIFIFAFSGLNLTLTLIFVSWSFESVMILGPVGFFLLSFSAPGTASEKEKSDN
jgi:hypothetical protein